MKQKKKFLYVTLPIVILAIFAAHPTNPVEEGIRMLTQKLSLYDT